MKNDRDLISAVKEKTDILAIAKACGLELKEHSPGQFVAPCPFHGERNASFRVYAQQNRFYCFGCQKKGDAIALYQEMQGLSLKEALARLAKMYGISLQGQDKYQPTPAELEARAFRAATSTAAGYYAELFWKPGNIGHSYLKQRGFSDEVLRDFNIGFAPDSVNGLLAKLKAKKIAENTAVDFGILARSGQGNLYDPFFGRVIFPVEMPNTGVLGFGGRDINGKSDAKYRNSHGNTFFHKGSVIYGLVQAAKYIRQANSAILVEGYIDTLAMHQFGFKNSVGSMGTAVTSGQLELLRQYTENVTILMDGDLPGRNAAVKAVKAAIEQGMNVKIVSLGSDYDPDSFLFSAGAEKMEELLGAARNGLEFYLSSLKEASPSALADWIRFFLNGFEDKLLAMIWAKRIGVFLGVATERILTAIDFQASRDLDEEKRDSSSVLQQ